MLRTLMIAAAVVFTAPACATQAKDIAMPQQTHALVLAPAGDPESAKVIQLVSSIPLAVDLANYDLAQAAFAPRVTVDYTSLWSGDAMVTTPAELMTSWRAIVPGFDATFHELSNVKADVRGNRATASAFVDGRHWIGAQLWRPVGHYLWELENIGGAWKVTKMTFAMTQEFGDRNVAMQAMQRAKPN